MSVFVPIPRFVVAPGRLARSELTSKIGRNRNQNFPRPGGALIPRLLVPVCDDKFLAGCLENRLAVPSTDNARRRLGRAVVLELGKALRNLPAEVLQTALPHPRLALGSFVIEDRTRNALERLLPIIGRQNHWTVEHYLSIPGFGARCLIDLLAAHEEAESASLLPSPSQQPARSASLAANLDDIAALLAAHLPLPSADVGPLIVRHGVTMPALTVPALAELYRSADRPVPFQVIRSQGVEIAVPQGSHGLMAAVGATAVRLCSLWGVVTTTMIADRVHVLRSAEVTLPMVKRLLVALPRLRWLDDRMQWFAMTGDRSGLRQAVAKVFAVADPIDCHDMRQALNKGRAAAQEIPGPVLDRYLRVIADAELDERGLCHRSTGERAALEPAEATLVRLLADGGGQMAADALRRAAATLSLSLPAVARLVKTSPLFLPGPDDRVGLVGHAGRHGRRVDTAP
ncbi:MAG: hypothetical protein QOI66_4895 [Myxococcales bacterium]|nr:hypothetical protein [Myxococcales bacterium]